MKSFLIVLFLTFFFFGSFTQNNTKIIIASAKIHENVYCYLEKYEPEVEVIDFHGVDIKRRHELLKNCKGLLLLGGKDINPTLYNKENLLPHCEIDFQRDSLELSLLKWADSLSLPIMGICRGMQFINVYFGGTLCADIPRFCKPANIKELHRDPKRKKDVFHSISIETNSILSTCFKNYLDMTVNSYHHQCIDVLAKPLKVVALSKGGTIEAVENYSEHRKSFVLGVQWHPERMFKDDQSQQLIFEKFLAAIKAR